jgi:hypothetical protein
MGRAAASQIEAHPSLEPVRVTLWELVWAVSEVAANEREVVATVKHLIATGQVRLCGTFRDDRPS